MFAAGQTLIVGADLPVASRIVQATPAEPYLALAIELQPGILGELAADLGAAKAPRPAGFRTLFVEDTNATLLDCAKRLVRLLDRPEAVPLLHEGIMRELHYWLITGPHGPALRALSEPASLARRLGQAITLLRQNYRERIPVERLAAAAGMSLTAFHRHFKQLTSLTPGQYQKRLRLVEARRLMLETGYTATRAALEWTEALTHLAQTGSIR